MRILVVNGGGSAGYAAAKFLEHLQEEMQLPWDRLFDMVVGVSTGSLIASAMAHKGMTAAAISKEYERSLPKIFKYRLKWKWLSELAAVFCGTVYNKKNLYEALHKLFGDSVFGKSELNMLCMVLATQISPYLRPYHWKSWIRDGVGDKDKIADVLTASCAAMYFFKPHQIGADFFVDGGIVANNPSMHAWIEARHSLQGNLPIKILNLQCLDNDWGVQRANKLGSLLSWRKWLVDAFIVSGEASVEYQAQRAVNGFYDSVDAVTVQPNYIEIPLGMSGVMTAVTAKDFEFMRGRAFAVWEAYKAEVLRFFEGVQKGSDPVFRGDSDGYRPQSVPKLTPA